MTERVRPAGRSLVALAWRQRWWTLLVAALVLLGGWAWLAARPGAYTAWIELTIDAERLLRALAPARETPLAGSHRDDPLVRLLLAEETRAEAVGRLAAAEHAEAARALATLDPQRVALESLPKSGYRLTVLAEEPKTAGLAVGALAAAFRERAVALTRTDWGRAIGDIDAHIRGEERARDAIESRINAFEKQNLPVLKEMADLDARLNKLRMVAGDLDLAVLEANAERDLLRRELQVTPPLIAYAVPPSTSSGVAPLPPRSPAASPSLSPSFPGAPGGPGAERSPRPQPPSALAPSPSSSPLAGLEGIDDRRGLVTMARQRLQQLQTSLDKLRQIYTDQHPDVKIVRRQIELLRANFPELSRPAKPGRSQPTPATRAVAGTATGKPARSPSVAGSGGGATAMPGGGSGPPGALSPARPPAALAGPPVRKATPATIDNTAVSGPARPNPAHQELAGKLSAREADIARLKARSAKARADAAALEKKAAKGAVVVAELERMDAERRAVQARLDSLSLERNELLAARALDARSERDAVRILAAPVVSLKPADRGGLRILERLPWVAGGAGLLAGLLATGVARRREGRAAALPEATTDAAGGTRGAAPVRRARPLWVILSALAFLAALGVLTLGQLVVWQMEKERGLNALVRDADRQDSLAPIEDAAREALLALRAKAEGLVEGWR